jgi:NADH/F420H2 dehydrogenase subunit C
MINKQVLLEEKYISRSLFYMVEFSSFIISNLSKYIRLIVINKDKNNLSLYLKNYQDIYKTLFFFKNNTKAQYDVLTDIFAIDLLKHKERFKVIYCLLSLRFNSRIRINLFADENSKIFTVTSLYSSSGWLEREIWDLFGIFFHGHIDLRRILTDYGFEGFPLRKDFPLSGFVEIRYDDSFKRIVYEPLETTQEFRFFDFKSPWDQIGNLY